MIAGLKRPNSSGIAANFVQVDSPALARPVTFCQLMGGSGVSVIQRNNVRFGGTGRQAMLFAHGFGCDQNMWRFVAPAFENDFDIVLFDHVGAGGSDLSAFDKSKYSTLNGYADDVVEIGTALGLKNAVFVGHSVSSMIGVLASQSAPKMFSKLVLIGPTRGTSTIQITMVALANSRSKSSFGFSKRIIWVGRLRWHQQSWATLHALSSVRN